MFHHTPFLYSSSRAIQLSLRSTAFWGSSLFFPCAPGQWMRYKSRKGLCRASRVLSRAARVLSYPWSQGAGYVIRKFLPTLQYWKLPEIIGCYWRLQKWMPAWVELWTQPWSRWTLLWIKHPLPFPLPATCEGWGWRCEGWGWEWEECGKGGAESGKGGAESGKGGAGCGMDEGGKDGAKGVR